MSDNSEIITVSDKHAPSSLDSVVGKAVEIVPIKLLIFIFIIYLLLSSDVFNEIILSRIDGAVGFGGKPSTYGTVLTGVALVSGIGLADVLIKKQII